MNNNPLIAKQFNPFVRKSSASPLSSLADTNLNTVQEPQAETPGTESESGPGPESGPESEAVTDQTNQNQPETPVDAADKAAPTDAPAAPVADVAPSPAADAAPVSGEAGAESAAESGTPSPAAPVSAEEAKAPVQEDTAKAPQAPAPQQADNASGNQSRRHRRLN